MELEKYPERVLRTKCKPVLEITDEDLSRAREMLDLMYQVKGLGLAGPQVHWCTQVVTLDVESIGKGERIFVNPRMLRAEGEVREDEGCLSLPGITVPVQRFEKVVVAAYTMRGERIEQEAEGLLARAWQHEIDHLNGILFIDRLDATELIPIRHRLRELEREAAERARR